MSGKKSGGNTGVAVDDIREDVARTRQQLGETTEALVDKADVKGRAVASARRHPVGIGAAVASVAAAVAAIGAWRWRKARQTPQSRAQRLLRDVKGRARDIRRDAKSRARDMRRDAKSRARGIRRRVS